MKGLGSIPPIELLLIGIAVSLILIAELDYDQMNVIGNFFIGVGGLLIIVASQGDYIKGLEQTATREELLKKQLALLQKQRTSSKFR